MALHPQAQAMRDQRERDRVTQLYDMTLADARAADLASIRAAGGEPEPVAEVVEHKYDGPDGPLVIRLYHPHRHGPADPAPALVYFYGGGWTLGSIDTADGIARALANAAGCVVAVPGYRLAPESKFPAAVYDCLAAARWVAANAAALRVDPARIAVGGDSAGGNLAAVVAVLARDTGGPALAGQLLVYPNTLYDSDTASMHEGTDPFMFNRTSVGWYWGHYLPDRSAGDDPRASPLRTPDLSGLPPALVITAEHDPLRDEGEAYAERLEQSGVPVTRTRYQGMVHGFFAMAGTLDAGAEAIDEAAGQLRSWFGGVDA